MKMKKEITAEDMPNWDLQYIAEQLGVAIAIQFAQSLGGTQISIPLRYRDNSTQIQLLSRYFDANQVLNIQQALSGLSISIPKSAYAYIHRESIVAAFDGTNANQLALTYNCSRQTIYKFAHTHREKSNNRPTLF